MQSCFNFKFKEVSRNLATDKEMRELTGLKQRIEHAYLLLSKPKKRTILCSNSGCDFTEKVEVDEFGLSYFQAIGTCPLCNSLTVYKNGQYTKEEIIFSVKEVSNG
jgi:hypothetical protein